ncbi:MAG: hypothetical protein R2856_27675 [Caldilineaceae bacterium]
MGDDVYVAGSFTAAGGVTANRVALEPRHRGGRWARALTTTSTHWPTPTASSTLGAVSQRRAMSLPTIWPGGTARSGTPSAINTVSTNGRRRAAKWGPPSTRWLRPGTTW